MSFRDSCCESDCLLLLSSASVVSYKSLKIVVFSQASSQPARGFQHFKRPKFCFKKGTEHGYHDIPQSLHYMHCTNPVRFAPGCTANFVCFLKRITSGEKRNPSWKMSGNLVWYDPAGFFHQVMHMHWPWYIIIKPHFWIWWVNIK